jgi:hypothetical protein
LKGFFMLRSPNTAFAQCLAFFGLLIAPPVMAQGVFDMGALTNTISISATTQAEAERAGNAVAAPSAAALNALKYEPSLPTRQDNIAKFITGLKELNPGVAGEFESVFAQVDIIEEIGKAVAPFGLKTDNMADAYTIYFMSAWMAANGRTDVNTPEQVAGVQQMAESALSSSPELLKLEDAKKQQFSEALLIQGFLFDAMLQATASDPVALAKVKADTRAGAKEMGIDVDLFELTPTGLVRKK